MSKCMLYLSWSLIVVQLFFVCQAWATWRDARNDLKKGADLLGDIKKTREIAKQVWKAD